MSALLGLWLLLAGVLPSWNEGPARQAIVSFVENCRAPQAERVAVFDSDGTMLCEQPIYPQFRFALDQPANADLLRTPLAELLPQGSERLLSRAFPGLTTDEFAGVASAWLQTARHPRFGRRYPELVYQPMRELLDYLREHGFKTYLVSGGPCEWLRLWAEEAYGIPPEQVLGSTVHTRFEMRGQRGVLVRTDQAGFRAERAGKPIDIERCIGRRPLLAVGNSDGDLEMLQYCGGLSMLVHHDDADREYAYDRQSPIGRLDLALDEAARRHWTVISMKSDWKVIFRGPGESD